MFQTFINIFRVPELRNKVLFTMFMLAIYRIGYHIPIPGVDQSAFNILAEKQKQAGGNSAAGQFASYVSLFSGGNLSQSTIFGLGVMPYISASIIFQLLATVIPALEKLQKEGEAGRKKIQEWTRYTTIPLALVQAVIWMSYMHHPGTSTPLVMPYFVSKANATFWVGGLFALTAGCIFLMWLGEQIDEYGLGNGVSLIILAGIVSRIPNALLLVYSESYVLQKIIASFFNLVALPYSLFKYHHWYDWMTPHIQQDSPQDVYRIGKIIFLILCFVFIVAGSILITQAQRRIPIQQAKHTRGRRVYGGQRQHLPLRVNHGGVMPIIFAQSLMLFPGTILRYVDSWLANAGWRQTMLGRIFDFLSNQYYYGNFLYIITEMAMIYFFAYFWTTVQFQPKEMANQLKEHGSFIPGLRPGKRTSDYLERVMQRITYVGAAFLCLLAVVPTSVSTWLSIDQQITQFLGGTGLLIVVSVALDMVQRIEANLLMRNYGGFLSGPGQKGKRIKGRQY
jgi:preprotein translocase subunit SecY